MTGGKFVVTSNYKDGAETVTLGDVEGGFGSTINMVAPCFQGVEGSALLKLQRRFHTF